MWNSQNGSNNATTDTESVKIKCNSKEYDLKLKGVQLIDRIKQIARENQIGKFDLFDETGKMLTPTDVEDGLFAGAVSLERFNQAA